jgi:hypothetical protein
MRTPYHDWGPNDLPDRNGYFRLRAIHPTDDGEWDISVSNRKRDQCRGEPWRAMELAHTVRATLLHPFAIFVGIRTLDGSLEDIEEEDRFRFGLCYVGNPDVRYHHRQGPRGRPNEFEERDPGRAVFCVFLNAARVVIGWHWTPESKSQPRLPEDWDIRFSKRLL